MGQRVGVRLRAVAVVVVLAGFAAACGSRLPDDVLADYDARGQGSATPAADGGDAASATDGATVADPGLITTDGGTTGGTGPGTGGATGPGTDGSAAASCGGGGATARGVSATEIKVGSIVTASGPLPGATEGAYRGAQAYFTKVNAAGGVCGRKITLLKGDDGLDPQRARGEFLRLEPQVFAMVGGFAVADSGFGDLIKSTGVPFVGTSVDPAGRTATVYPKVAVGATHTGPFQYYRNTYPSVKKAAFLFADVGGVRANTPSSREGLKKVGFDIVYDSGLSSISPDFTSDVIAMRDRGAQMVYLFAFEVNMHVRISRNMRQQNFEPPLKVANIGYNSRLVDLLGDIANGWTNHIDYLPVLNADEPGKSPPLADFLAWNQRSSPGAQLDLFPVTGWGNAELFVRALRAVGAEVTRPRLLAALAEIKSDDYGGIHAPLDPTSGRTEGCFIIVRLKDRKWIREHPSSGFECGLGEVYRYG